MTAKTYTFGDGSTAPLYLTNGCCEPTHDYVPDLFGERGLPAGEFDGEFYPLTDAEAVYIGEDVAKTADGYLAFLGYSSLYKGEKFLMPSIEVLFGEEDEPGREEAHAFVRALSDDLRPRIEAIGGHVFIVEDYADRQVIQVLVPFSYAMENASAFYEWKAHLENVLLKSDVTLQASASPAP